MAKRMTSLGQTSDLFVDQVDDDAEVDEAVAPLRYDITSFGVDYDVEGLVRRLQRKDIVIPEFQRSYVWALKEASRFVESLLLGLPVPGVFFAKETETNRLLVIDGQQRLKTLQFFYEGFFNPKVDDATRRVFALTNVQARFKGKTYKTLDQPDKLKLDNSVIHAIVVKQEAPPGQDTSMYHIFDRLNSGGTRLTGHEIRCAMYHGPLIEKIKALNDHENWRTIFGKASPRLKDQELILRFLALYLNADQYERPMAEFLNIFATMHSQAEPAFLDRCQALFTSPIDIVLKGVGKKAFRLGHGLNAAVFDSVMVGLARRINDGRPVDAKKFAEAYDKLLSDKDYVQAVSRSTADKAFVSMRLDKATSQFASL